MFTLQEIKNKLNKISRVPWRLFIEPFQEPEIRSETTGFIGNVHDFEKEDLEFILASSDMVAWLVEQVEKQKDELEDVYIKNTGYDCGCECCQKCKYCQDGEGCDTYDGY